MGLLSFILGLAGCDQQRISELEEGVATEADVRTRFGEPEKIWDAADMASVPLPRTTPDGKMSSLRQVLSPQNFKLVIPGMSMEQVRKLLGKPMKVTPFVLKKQTEYDWRYLSSPTQPYIFTTVFDADLRVVSTGSAEEALVNPMGAGGQR
jgi:SmpA / OmlA family